ncbi:hypothetical protein AB0001_004773 [Salmonella enterica]|nr:hypothetical protein [Salmonella enterica]EEP3373009.1 hypothetical protein [Salmonella enterica]EFP6579716.1 hypothetical protein [Salmonella enterica]EGC7970999.1 hypothetical protein [Salmonella enterica]EIV4461176.1 hypothetical protein [Salmonella enterica]
MKVAIINFSGNNGKTTLGDNLFVPRIPDALYLTVESINAGSEAEKVRGKDFGVILEEMMMSEKAIIDVGASNVEDLMKLMRQYKGSHEEFDLFVVPAVKESKQIDDTMSTIRALSALGVPSKKIKVVMNKVEVDDAVEDVFFPLFAMHKEEKLFTLSPAAKVESSEIYPLLKTYGTSIEKLLGDSTDWRLKMREAKTEEEKRTAVRMISMTRLARSAKDNLDNVFKIITGK